MEISQTYYEVLEINIEATKEQIRASYIRLVKVYHPDKFQNADEYGARVACEKMKSINTAYATLSDERKRIDYNYSIKANYQSNSSNYSSSASNNRASSYGTNQNNNSGYGRSGFEQYQNNNYNRSSYSSREKSNEEERRNRAEKKRKEYNDLLRPSFHKMKDDILHYGASISSESLLKMILTLSVINVSELDHENHAAFDYINSKISEIHYAKIYGSKFAFDFGVNNMGMGFDFEESLNNIIYKQKNSSGINKDDNKSYQKTKKMK